MFPLRDNIPTQRRPVMTWTLIAVTSAVYLVEVLVHPQHLEQIAYLFGIVPARYAHPAWAARVGYPADDYWPFLTTIFLHAGWVHLASNMWFLWVFGDNVEDRIGHARFLEFYLLCGITAGIVHTWTTAIPSCPPWGPPVRSPARADARPLERIGRRGAAARRLRSVPYRLAL